MASEVTGVRGARPGGRRVSFLRVALPLVVLAGTLGVPSGPGGAQTGPAPVPAGVQAQGVKVVGYSNLGGQGLNGPVSVVGTTAVVAAGYTPMGTMSNGNTKIASVNTGPPCVTVPVKVVDISDPTRPSVAGTIPVPKGQAARDVDALHVSTPAFTGDLVAIAFATCQLDYDSFLNRFVVQPGSFAHRGVAYYDVSDRSRPRFLSRYHADFEDQDPQAPPCGPGDEVNCAQDQFSVRLQRLRDGRILSVSGKPDSIQNASTAGDIRLVDVTDPTKPTQLSSWPRLDGAPAQTGPNGCFPRAGGRTAELSPDGTRLYVPYLDGGVHVVDVRDLANPRSLGVWSYPADWDVEGQAAFAAPAEVAGRQLAVVSEEDWWWPTSSLRVDAPSSIAGVKQGCAGLWTLADLRFQSQAFAKPGGQVPGELVFVGRGCPARRAADGSTTAADPLLGNPAGKIAVAGDPPSGAQPGGGCPGVARQRYLEDAGAIAIVSSVTSTVPESVSTFTTGAWPAVPVDQNQSPTGLYVGPNVQVKQAAGEALRTLLCPTQAADGKCVPAQPVTGAVVDLPGEWGGLRLLDVSNPAAPSEVAVYRSPGSRVFPPPDIRGVYSAGQPVVDGTRVYAAWNSDGLRILDLKSGLPVEVGSFIPPDTTDPTGTVPPKAFVVGVDYTSRHIVVSDMSSGLWILEKPAPFAGRGYWLASADGGVFALGDAPFFGSAGALKLTRPVVGLSASPTGGGYWLVAADGGVFSFGDAVYRGSMGGGKLNAPIVGMAPTGTGNGYWLAAADGGVFAFGDARFHGSMGGTALKAPIVGIAGTPGGRGYRLAAADGGVFAFGDASFLGSAGGLALKSPVVGIERTASGRGYHLAAADGGVFAFGDAVFAGSAAGGRLASPVVGMEAAPGTTGYWMVGADGGVYALGAPFLGSLGGTRLNARVVGVATVPK
ncbi:MAG: hypothetical protein ACT4PX_08030 [Actinomycetota bacterium]